MAEAHHDGLVSHQFETVEQQQETVTLGMWVFIVQEVMFFGGLFMVYLTYRYLYPEAFGAGSHHLDVMIGAVNTTVLIASSLTMALAVHAAQTDRTRSLVLFLVLTLLLGSVFLGVKVVEYGDKFQHHLVPGFNFHWDGPLAGQAEIFFSCYFLMTGMHALHMIIGAGILLVLIPMALRGRFGSHYFTPIENFGLYWHFVDIVWIFLFPMLYLIARHH